MEASLDNAYLICPKLPNLRARARTLTYLLISMTTIENQISCHFVRAVIATVGNKKLNRGGRLLSSSHWSSISPASLRVNSRSGRSILEHMYKHHTCTPALEKDELSNDMRSLKRGRKRGSTRQGARTITQYLRIWLE